MDDIFGIIFAICCFLVPLVAKLIDVRLRKAGDRSDAMRKRQARRMAGSRRVGPDPYAEEAARRAEEESRKLDLASERSVRDERKSPQYVYSRPAAETAPVEADCPAEQRGKPRRNAKKHVDIDKKKLIVYSEIMKPKYLDE